MPNTISVILPSKNEAAAFALNDIDAQLNLIVGLINGRILCEVDKNIVVGRKLDQIQIHAAQLSYLEKFSEKKLSELNKEG